MALPAMAAATRGKETRGLVAAAVAVVGAAGGMAACMKVQGGAVEVEDIAAAVVIAAAIRSSVAEATHPGPEWPRRTARK